jgi:hypothetical protein
LLVAATILVRPGRGVKAEKDTSSVAYRACPELAERDRHKFLSLTLEKIEFKYINYPHLCVIIVMIINCQPGQVGAECWKTRYCS